MSSTLLIYILVIAAVSLLIGAVVGWFLASLGRDKQASKEEKIRESLRNYKLVLRVWRSEKNSRLVYELDGKKFPDSMGMNPQESRELLRLMQETSRWLGLPEEDSLTRPSVRNTGNLKPKGEAPAAQTTLPAASGAVFTAEPGPFSTVGAEQKPPSLIDGVTNTLASVINPGQAPRPDAPKSIVQQIDEVFQTKLEAAGFTKQRIYLTEDPRKGVIVCVGASIYEGIGALPEGDVKNVLRDSVKEWERGQELLKTQNKR